MTMAVQAAGLIGPSSGVMLAQLAAHADPPGWSATRGARGLSAAEESTDDYANIYSSRKCW
jgi:hypothetical protein